ncbi:MAG: hypothetical protein DI535_15710 [Citrobacter freundii]|nr:MAG: hypothetical protein DI535_15710 [Citrobacter freundii]
MELNFYRPRHQGLSDVIEGYYFLRGIEERGRLSYRTFPNNFAILSVLRDAVLDIGDHRVDCLPSDTPGMLSNLTVNYQAPITINYSGPVNELTVYFKPLGLYAFCPLALEPQDGAFQQFSPFGDFQESMRHILEQQDRDVQCRLLEDYWLSRKLLAVEPFMQRLLEEIEGSQTIIAIASKLGVSRQYLNRRFHQYLGKTPLEFRRIQRFRNALKAKATARNLTDLAAGSLFYDQSHFIREFRTLTHLSPKSFFDKTDTAGENVWLYI